MHRVIGTLLSLLLLAACERTPAATQLEQDLMARLVAAFGAGTFEIADLARRGSAADVTAPPGETRRVVYFDVDLRAAKDIAFGGWDTPGAAAMVTALGAGPRGIVGIKAEGNKAGEIVRAHGSVIYRRSGEAWASVTPSAFSTPVAPAIDNQAAPPATARLITALQATIRAAPSGTTPSSQSVIEQELNRALANIQGRLARMAQGIGIAGGPAGGQYTRFVQALEIVGRGRNVRILPLVTAGTVENLELLREGQVVFALAQGDVAALALAGEGPFAGTGPFRGLRALGSLYPEPVHVILRGDAAEATVAALAGKRINIGPMGAGTRITAESVLAAHGLGRGSYVASDLPLPEALAALRGGRIDAVIQIIGAPAEEIRGAAASFALKFLALDPAAVARLSQQNPAYFAQTIAQGTYPGQAAPVATAGVAAQMVTGPEVTELEARQATMFLFSRLADLVAAGSVQGAQIQPATARRGLAIPLHAGAERVLVELGAP